MDYEHTCNQSQTTINKKKTSSVTICKMIPYVICQCHMYKHGSQKTSRYSCRTQTKVLRDHVRSLELISLRHCKQTSSDFQYVSTIPYYLPLQSLLMWSHTCPRPKSGKNQIFEFVVWNFYPHRIGRIDRRIRKILKSEMNSGDVIRFFNADDAPHSLAPSRVAHHHLRIFSFP